jgi:hypothetical protein
LQRLGSVERDQTGQRASAGQDLDQGADVAGWVSAWSPDRARQASTRKKGTGSTRPADRLRCSVPALAGQHEAVLVVRLGVGVVARSSTAGEHQEEGHGISPASTSSSCSASAGTRPARRRSRLGGTRWCWWPALAEMQSP